MTFLDPHRFPLTPASSSTKPVLSSGRFTCPAVVTVPSAATFMMLWTQMLFAKFFHLPAEVQRVLLVSEPLPFSEINPRITKVLQAWSAVFSGPLATNTFFVIFPEHFVVGTMRRCQRSGRVSFCNI